MSDGFERVSLMPCLVNGEQSSLIVAVQSRDRQTMEVLPLFVALCSGMKITDPNGDSIYGSVQSA